MKARKKGIDKILVVTMGCSKNTVDSEKLMHQLSAHAVEIEHNKDNSDARTVIINTCGFINDAKQESIDTILNFADAHKKGIIDNLYVMGCLSERYAGDLKKEIPEVDQFFGVNDVAKIVEKIGFNYREELLGERLVSTPSHYAYLKVSEGCNKRCSFCAIPLIRGGHKSLSIESLVDESKKLRDKGVKELILIAQDLTYYGRDLYGKYELVKLLENLSAIDGIEWLRLHYAYPSDFPLELLDVMRENPKICKYLDIPFQHVSTQVLKNMRRGMDKDGIVTLLNEIRNRVPGISVRTTLLVGHPGEGEKEFNELLEFIKWARFDRLGVFPYSHEEDTYGFKHFKDEISDKIKKQRADIIMKAQQQISAEINALKVGKTFKVLIDRKEKDYYVGRTEFDSPEIDNEVLIKSEKPLPIGSFQQVTINDATEFDLYGRV